MRNILIAYITLLFSITLHGHSWHIFFDLPKTLLEPNELAFFKDVMGVWSTLGYTAWGNNPWKLEEIMFKTLDTLGKQNVAPEAAARSHKDRILPQIFCDFLSSKLKSDDAIIRVKQQIQKLGERGFYAGSQEQELVTRIVQAIFTPLALAKHTSLIPGGLQLVRECARKQSTRNLYIIANWDSASLLMLMKMDHGQELFNYFSKDHIYISGSSKLLLPDIKSFEPPIKFHNMHKHHCIYISGVARHVEAARKFGIKAYWINNGNYAAVSQELRSAGII